jgi:hypothetical protein
VERINTRFGVGTAKPIHYRYAQLPAFCATKEDSHRG